ncbi:hypothetical protein [Jiangella asiatica]|uniref:Uncharacterized protein n=1 Tax=Jiangella asiatica TaxID=2530372 RepID=A0A4R5DFD3_9ACTN|nr:hypothetical protein [Jiangella asiatica]TDE10660.1 hypothetical protein E1269_11340 [Jiangella asiatica]
MIEPLTPHGMPPPAALAAIGAMLRHWREVGQLPLACAHVRPGDVFVVDAVARACWCWSCAQRELWSPDATVGRACAVCSKVVGLGAVADLIIRHPVAVTAIRHPTCE